MKPLLKFQKHENILQFYSTSFKYTHISTYYVLFDFFESWLRIVRFFGVDTAFYLSRLQEDVSTSSLLSSAYISTPFNNIFADAHAVFVKACYFSFMRNNLGAIYNNNTFNLWKVRCSARAKNQAALEITTWYFNS